MTPRGRQFLIQLIIYVCILLAACSQTSLLAANDMGTVTTTTTVIPVDETADSAELEDTAG